MKVYLSPSTQDKNIGVGNYGTEEKRMNELADLMTPHLKRNGFQVERNNISFTPTQSAKDSNTKIGSNGLHIALHTNAGGGVGTEIFYFTGSSKGKHLATNIYNEVAPLTPGADRGIKPTKQLTEIVATLSPSILIEVDFHDNKESVHFMLSNLDKIAQAIVKGICKNESKFYIPVPSFVPGKEETSTDTSKGFYRVITGSFNNKDNAAKRVEELTKKGYNSFIEYKGE